jgi:glycerate 2-kinase
MAITEQTPVEILLELLKDFATQDLLKDIELEQTEKLYLLGMGKAAPALCLALEDKYQFIESLILGNDIGGHPFMDEGSLVNGQRLKDYVARIPKDHHLVVAVTGGASATIEILHPFFQDKKEEFFSMQKEIVLAGKSIEKMNKLRKSLSILKNGGLLELCNTHSIESLVISDIPEKNLSDVGSGPTAYSTLNLEELREIAKGVFDKKLLTLYLKFLDKHQEELVRDVEHHPFKVIADYSLASKKMKEYHWKEGLHIILDPLNFSLDEGVEFLLKEAPGKWIFSGGEFPINVNSEDHGLGGRNQHLVLEFARKVFFKNELGLSEELLKQCYIVSVGSDGIDGNTDAAGAFFDYDRLKKAQALGLEPEYYLEMFDSSTFLKKVDALIKTGPSDTNIMDLRLSFVPKKN